MTMSIRLLGPLPGLIVILYLAFTLREKSLPVVTAYLVCATVVMFLTWPYLWPDPLGHWMDSLVLMARFPWPGHVLFNGQFHEAESLPVSYLPVLLNIQLTESLLILIYSGFAALVLSIIRKRLKLDLFLVTVIGALLPLTALILARATLYDNFRQILFLLPPLMLLAGLALDLVFPLLKPVVLRLALLIVITIPGMYAIIQLHPYQYVYYNSLIGGTGGAFRNFEMDYWCTSYREAALWLNDNAPANASIGGDGPTQLLHFYLRPDLNLQPDSQPETGYDYFVITSRYNQDLNLYPGAEAAYSVERNGAVLTVIKRPSP